MSHSQVNISLFSSSFYLENFNADVAIMMKMWDIATSYQGGRGLASFVGSMHYTLKSSYFKNKARPPLVLTNIIYKRISC